ncbi:hypothetical protein ACLOJK_007366 [Asimina triloba]
MAATRRGRLKDGAAEEDDWMTDRMEDGRWPMGGLLKSTALPATEVRKMGGTGSCDDRDGEEEWLRERERKRMALLATDDGAAGNGGQEDEIAAASAAAESPNPVT